MKQKKGIKQQKEKITPAEGGISRRGWKVVIAGIIVLILGFFVLSKTDPEGQNLASIISPILIIGGYVIIGIGILTK